MTLNYAECRSTECLGALSLACSLDFVDLAAASCRKPEELARQLLAVGVKGDESFLDKLRLTAGLQRGIFGADLVAFCCPEIMKSHLPVFDTSWQQRFRQGSLTKREESIRLTPWY
jgi:hypothetical protein